jgi:hypothetical protein
MNSILNPVNEQIQREIERLNQEIGEIQAEIQASEQEVKDIMEREARGEGVFAARVFELKQGKMRMITEIQHRKVHINHLLLDPEASDTREARGHGQKNPDID